MDDVTRYGQDKCSDALYHAVDSLHIVGVSRCRDSDSGFILLCDLELLSFPTFVEELKLSSAVNSISQLFIESIDQYKEQTCNDSGR